MVQLSGYNPHQTRDGVGDELATCANGHDCQGGNRTNQANHEKMKTPENQRSDLILWG